MVYIEECFFIKISLDASVTLDVSNGLFLGIYVIGDDENRDGLCMFYMTIKIRINNKPFCIMCDRQKVGLSLYFM
jgi:hypothetical protein